MSDEPDARAIDDELLQRWLDGELTPAAAAQVERRLAVDASLAARVAVLRDMETWLRDSRPVAPPNLAAHVMQAIQQPPPVGATVRLWQWCTQRALQRAWMWAPVAAAVILVLLLTMREGSPPQPSDGRAVSSFAVRQGDSAAAFTTQPAADSVRCVFKFAAKDAQQVCLVGSFNRWRVCDTPLRPTPDGKWAVTVELPRGRYEYVFVVDGKWVADPAAPFKVEDGFGGQKAILLL
jgi:hypothetical protein